MPRAILKPLLSICLSGLTGLALSQTLPQSLEVAVTPLSRGACSSTFVSHSLEHVTQAHHPDAIGAYDSMGAGVAAGDLDGDGDLELVLANLKSNNRILWNEGALQFRAEELSHGNSRGVAVVDVDGDGWNDLVFTQSTGAPNIWRGAPEGFRRMSTPDLNQWAYSMAWADLDGDGDLDLATASYDALLEKELRDTFLFSAGAGVFVYQQTLEGFERTRLQDEAQGLALIVFDVNADRKPDILVGNDFAVPDYVYLNTDGAWTPAHPFAVTTRNTMSFDTGDIDNDGEAELFATDMKPDFGDVRAIAAWMPLMQKTYEQQRHHPAQRVENALQRRVGDHFENVGYALGLDASGWSWSGKFGDLDNDGLLDIYVVNGMVDGELLRHLPGGELVEENQAFHNLGDNRFERASWGLGSTSSGRGMTMADLDNDGDLDIVVNNLETPAILFENQLCGGDGLEVDLFWQGLNTRALGASLTLHTDKGSFSRDVRATSGYLSGDPARVHFGVPEGTTVERLEIRWPDAQLSVLESLTLNSLVTITRRGGP